MRMLSRLGNGVHLVPHRDQRRKKRKEAAAPYKLRQDCCQCGNSYRVVDGSADGLCAGCCPEITDETETE